MDEQELLALKEEISEAKQKLVELNAEKKYLITSLKDEFDCTTIKAAETLKEGMKKDLETLYSQIGDAQIKFKNKFPEIFED